MESKTRDKNSLRRRFEKFRDDTHGGSAVSLVTTMIISALVVGVAAATSASTSAASGMLVQGQMDTAGQSTVRQTLSLGRDDQGVDGAFSLEDGAATSQSIFEDGRSGILTQTDRDKTIDMRSWFQGQDYESPVRELDGTYVIGFDEGGNPVWSKESGSLSVQIGRLAASGSRICGVVVSEGPHKGDGYCWGANSHGQIGNGTTRDAWTPVKFGSAKYDSFAVSDLTTCAIRQDRKLECAGDNSSGQIDVNNTNEIISTPTIVDGGRSVSQATVSSSGITYIDNSGAVRASGLLTRASTGAWKTMGSGAERIPTSGNPATNYHRIVGGKEIKTLKALPKIASDSQSVCFVDSGRNAQCWSINNLGMRQKTPPNSPDRNPFRPVSFVGASTGGVRSASVFLPIGQPSFEEGENAGVVARGVKAVYMAHEDTMTNSSLLCTIGTDNGGRCVPGYDDTGVSRNLGAGVVPNVFDIAVSTDDAIFLSTPNADESRGRAVAYGDRLGNSTYPGWFHNMETSTGNTGTFCGVDDNHSVKCVGNNDAAQASADGSSTPFKTGLVTALDDRYPQMTSVALMDQTTCAAGGDSTPMTACFGRADLGQTGTGALDPGTGKPYMSAKAAKIAPIAHDYKSLYGLVTGGQQMQSKRGY